MRASSPRNLRARDRTTASVRSLIVATLLALVVLLAVFWNAG